MSRTESRTVSMSKELWDVVDELAEEYDVPRSKIIQQSVWLMRLLFSEKYTLEKFISDILLTTPVSHIMEDIPEVAEELGVMEDEIPDLFLKD